LTGTRLNTPGTDNDYTSYSSQTQAIFKKYNGRDAIGNEQLRGVIDTRTAFIAGEGLSVISKDENLLKFVDDFFRFNKLKGSRFNQFIQQGEMEGRVLLYLKADNKNKNIKLLRHLTEFSNGYSYKVNLLDNRDTDSIKSITIKKGDEDPKDIVNNFEFIKTGGDFSNVNEPTTRAGLCLHAIDSYARAKNAMRKNNHLFAKITPFFSSENQSDVEKFRTLALSKQWKIGDAMSAMKGKLEMVVPAVGAMENLKQEQTVNAKTISFVTGIPVHWMGWVDLMSNRSTAESLYETINNATIQDRNIWSESIYSLIIKAQEMAIDKGFLKGTLNYDFEVKIPLIAFYKMKPLVEALSLAYADNAISIQDYRNNLPGIDPYKTAQMSDSDIQEALKGMKNDNIGDTNDNE
jgi:hypothetical protein